MNFQGPFLVIVIIACSQATPMRYCMPQQHSYFGRSSNIPEVSTEDGYNSGYQTIGTPGITPEFSFISLYPPGTSTILPGESEQIPSIGTRYICYPVDEQPSYPPGMIPAPITFPPQPTPISPDNTGQDNVIEPNDSPIVVQPPHSNVMPEPKNLQSMCPSVIWCPCDSIPPPIAPEVSPRNQANGAPRVIFYPPESLPVPPTMPSPLPWMLPSSICYPSSQYLPGTGGGRRSPSLRYSDYGMGMGMGNGMNCGASGRVVNPSRRFPY